MTRAHDIRGRPRARVGAVLGVLAMATGLALAAAAPPASANLYFNPVGIDLESAALDGTNYHLVNQPSPAIRLTPDGGLASDGTHLYLGYHGDDEVGPEGIDRVSGDGTGYKRRFVRATVPDCADALGSAPGEDAIAVAGGEIYWAEPFAGTIGRANAADGSGVDSRFIVTAGGACSPMSGIGTRGLAVDSTHIYWTNPDQDTIGRANLDGSGVDQSFITGLQDPWDVAVSGPNLYWTSAGTGTIGHAQLDGTDALVPGSATSSFITGLTPSDADAGPAAIAAQGNELYFDNGDGWIGRASADGTIVVHHLLQVYDDDAGRPAPPAIAADADQPSPTATSVTCGASSVHLLAGSRGAGAPEGNATGCSVIVRHVGPAPGPVSGDVQLSAAPVKGGIVSASGDLVPHGTCALKATKRVGVSACTFEYAADAAVRGFTRHASSVVLTAAYGGETTHSASTGTGHVGVVTVHPCLRAGDEFMQTCDARGQLETVSGVAIRGATRVTTYVLFGGGLSLTLPKRCVRTGHSFTAGLTFKAAQGEALRLRRAALTLGHQRDTLAHAPFRARLRLPSRNASLTAHLVFSASAATRDTDVTVKLGLPAC
jgi:hypothetical protein